jgi:hypothetical protein
MLEKAREFAGNIFGARDNSMRKLQDISIEIMSQDLPPVEQPKVKAGNAAIAPYLTSTRESSAALPKSDRRLANLDTVGLRAGTSTTQVLHDFAIASPDLSAAVFAYIRTAITANYLAVAKNPDGSFNPEATQLLQQIITRMDVLPNYADGFGGSYSIRSVSESLAREIITYGAMSGELVLDKALTPWRIQPIHVGHIEFEPDGNDLKPVQVLAGERRDLDIPTFFYTSLDQDLLTPYASSPFESAIRPTIFSEDFVNDLWRVVKQAVHPRQHVKIIMDKLAKQIPLEALHDETKKAEWLNGIVSQVTNSINQLGVNDALIYFDFIEVERETNGNISLSQEWQTLEDIANSKLSTGAKTLPAILGHGARSSNIASTESMLFVKSVSGAVQEKLNEFYSRMFTLSLRMYGLDVVVSFKYETIDLRPESELESFKSLKQSRILELLSLGLISDEEASLQLNGKLPPAGYKPLSGTMFQSKKAETKPSGDTNDGSTLNQNLNSDAPSGGARGSNTKSNPVKEK